ncbi:MAG: FRG domain-containing protein [Caldilineaceae bacterium]|nr:FRG domain-containing protein [Caldilineaceae bacterium]
MNINDVLIEIWRSEARRDDRKQVRDLIGNLALVAEQDLESTFIYRGESECNARVSSGLFRQFYELDNECFDIMGAQCRQLKKASAYVRDESDCDKILAQIQHKGGKTNLIDFTADLNIALFFACYYSPDEDGRIIFFKSQPWDDYCIKPAIQPSNMADAQKSLFVVSIRGYIRDEDITVYEIPRELKAGILNHLRDVYGIEPSTVYNDLSGFIRDQDLFPDFEADIYAGERYFSEKDYCKAVKYYTKGLENPTVQFRSSLGFIYPNVYRQRGIANYYVGNLNDAYDDLHFFDSSEGDWEGKPEIPEEIRNWYTKNKRARQEEKERQREFQRASDAETAAGIQTICIEAQYPDGSPVDGTRFKLLSEDGYEDSGEIKAGRMQALIPAECCGSKCWLWFNKEGYCGFNPLHAKLGDSLTIALKPDKCNADPKEVTIKITYAIEERA